LLVALNALPFCSQWRNIHFVSVLVLLKTDLFADFLILEIVLELCLPGRGGAVGIESVLIERNSGFSGIQFFEMGRVEVINAVFFGLLWLDVLSFANRAAPIIGVIDAGCFHLERQTRRNVISGLKLHISVLFVLFLLLHVSLSWSKTIVFTALGRRVVLTGSLVTFSLKGFALGECFGCIIEHGR
jgi:hypothetical protein